MPIEVFVEAELDTEEVAEAITSKRSELEDPEYANRRTLILAEGFRATNKVRSAGEDGIGDHTGLRPMFFTTTSRYLLRERQDDSPQRGSPDQTHPLVIREVYSKAIWQVQCRLRVEYELFIRKGEDVDDDAILMAWEAFSIGDDPNIFSAQQGIPAGDFWALAKWTLLFGEENLVRAPDDPTDPSSPQYPLSQDGGLFDLYDPDRGERPEGRFRLEYLDKTRSAFVKEASEGDVLEGDVANPDLRQVENELRERAQGSARICNGYNFKTENKRVGTIFAWPEFRIRWERKSIKIGCARISFKVPYLERRTGKKALMVTVAYPDAGIIFEKIILKCLGEAAISSAVIGLLTTRVEVALVAFKTYFEACVSSHATRYIECLVPKLTVVREASSWKRV